jgi:AcrR family transcriptional regulator
MLTPEKILDAAEEVLRRFGPRKTTVVDVARLLEVSHGTVYRHFESKAALHAAITKRWLEHVTAPLIEISQKKTKPKQRLREWFETLMKIKLQKAKDDPEMFASYSLLAQKLPEHIVFGHLAILIKQVEGILTEGCQDGSFEVESCSATAHSFFFATTRFHHPLHVNEWKNVNITEDFNHLFDLLERAIKK